MKKSEITKFIRGNYHSGIVQELLDANNKMDKAEFLRLLEKIKMCIYIKQEITEASAEILSLREAIKTRKYKLSKMMNGKSDLLAGMGIDIDISAHENQAREPQEDLEDLGFFQVKKR